jgi:VWFA-related protein
MLRALRRRRGHLRQLLLYAARLIGDAHNTSRRTTGRRFWLLVLTCSGLAAVPATGRQDPPPRFKTGIHVVEVDATVFDAAGRPVQGLTASDFTVRENGEPRRVVGVTEVSMPVGSPETVAASSRNDVADNQSKEGRLLVLFIDDATLPLDLAAVQAAKDAARGAVERMGPADMMSVVFTGHASHAQDFTRDRDRLRRSIDRTTVGFDLSGSGTQRLWGASVNTLLNIAEALRDVPRHRKAILYVSIGIPGGAAGFVQRWRRLVQSSPGSNIPIYSFDPSGVGGLEAFNATHPYSAISGNLNQFREFLRDVSSNTGGRAAVLTNTFDQALDRLFEDTASYYLIGYQTPQPTDDGRFRRLEVHTTRPGTTARARPFFFSSKTSSRPSGRRSPSTIAYDALANVIPVGDLPMRATAAPFAGTGRDPATVAIVMALRHPTAGTGLHRVDLVTGVFEQEGRQRALRRQEATVRFIEPTPDVAVYEVATSIGVQPGRYRLRIGAHNRAVEQSGSIFLDVDVPDFARDRLSLSGLVVGTSAAPKQAVVPGVRSMLPFQGSTLREFSRSETVSGFLRVYQGGSTDVRNVQVFVRVLDERGTALEPAERPLRADQFSRMRAADVTFPIPVGRLAPGSYTLQVEASAPDSPVATRELAFAIR